MDNLTHSLVADNWTRCNPLIRQRLKIQILEKIEQHRFTFLQELDSTYILTEEQLLEKFAEMGEIVSADHSHSLVAENYVLLSDIVDSDGIGGKQKGVVFTICTSYGSIEKVKDSIEREFEKYKKSSIGARIGWAIKSKDNLEVINLYNALEEKVYTEAYPYIEVGIESYIYEYFKSESPVLLMMGRPGAGKTRLLRYMMQILATNKGRDAKVLYTMEEDVFADDRFYLRFLTDDYDALVLEDIDLNLKSRKDGNVMMHKLLAGADGFIRNKNKKIILTTNITSIRDIDEALLREGRCYGKIETRNLTPEEAEGLAFKINSACDFETRKEMSVAEVYDAINRLATKKKEKAA